MADEREIEVVARAIVASDFFEQRLGELTDERWHEMLAHWRELESEPLIRSGHRVEDAMRRAGAALAAIAKARRHPAPENEKSLHTAAGTVTQSEPSR